MITIITGLPGNGKTLYALSYIKAYSEKENREVFYSGIKDLVLPWTEIKPEEWLTMPPGSIIVIDEAQFTFPKKPNGSKLPDYYEKLATHRHSGYDIFIITQHPSLVDNFVRQLAGRHLHIIRKFGMQRANVWEWPSANMSPEKASSHKNAILHKFAYPKAVYGYYKSAEVHTVKRAIPVKLILAVLFVVAVIGIGYYVLDRFQKKATGHIGGPSAPGSSGSQNPSPPPIGKASYLNAVADAHQYIFDRTPRIVGLEYTSPRYDEVTKPTTAPVPVSCVASATRCNCYSQQATPLQMPDNICRNIVHTGFFQDFDDGSSKRQSERAIQSQVALNRPDDALPLTHASTRDVASKNVDIGGFGILAHRDGVRVP